MSRFRVITPGDMRLVNRTAVWETIRLNGPVSRGRISEMLGISLPSVIRIVNELEEQKLVRSTGESEFSGGRKRPLLEINAEDNIAIGIDLGGTKIFGMVCDLSGRSLFEHKVENHMHRGESCGGLVLRTINELRSKVIKAIGKDVMGVGIGVPGVTDVRRGIIEWSPSLELRNFPMMEFVERETGLPAIVDNDVNASALGEMWFGHGRNLSNLVFVNIGTGIGSGIILDGALYRGAHLYAGEMGYMLWDRACLDSEYPDHGALEQVASGVGIARRAAKLGKNVSAREVFDAARRGEEWAKTLEDDAADYLAMGLIGLVSVADPEVIVMGGGVSSGSLVDRIRERMRGKIPCLPEIRATELGERGAVLGSIINLMHRLRDFCFVRSMS